MKYSQTEIKELLTAWAILSLAFGIVLNGGFEAGTALVLSIVISALTAGVGFIFHELAHKYYAQKYGCKAEFRSNMNMLILALIMSFFGFIFAAPGAVVIHGYPGRVRNGHIALAGPAMNIIIALIFILISFFSTGIVATIATYGMYINSFLALFNMLPFGIFDGAKVLAWNKTVYGVAVGIAGVLTFFSFAF